MSRGEARERRRPPLSFSSAPRTTASRISSPSTSVQTRPCHQAVPRAACLFLGDLGDIDRQAVGLIYRTTRIIIASNMTIRITALDYALLGLLHQSPQSGYDLRRVFETTAIGDYSGSPGAIYPALRRLEQQGLVMGQIDTTTALRPKKIFRPTTAGRKALRDWLVREIQREDVKHRLDELMLRFAFHGVQNSRKATLHFLESFLREVEGYLGELIHQREELPDELPLHPRLALTAGIEQFRASARWARKALREFTEESS